MITRWGVELPEREDLPALPEGVVYHWTGGTGKANDVDRAAYHYIVEADGRVVAGKWPVAANMRKLGDDDHYAAHTGGFNSFRIGIAAAGMAGYEGPSKVGRHPLTKRQIRRMCELGAYFCTLAALDSTNPKHVCTHREVWTLHGIRGQRNDQKRDIEHLPFRPDLKPAEIGPELRILTGLVISETLRDALDLGLVKWPTPAVSIPTTPKPAPELLHTEPVRARSPQPAPALAETPTTRSTTVFGREPAAIIGTALSLLQILGILWANGWDPSAVDPQLWGLPALTFGGAFATRQKVMPVQTIKQAGYTPEYINLRATDYLTGVEVRRS